MTEEHLELSYLGELFTANNNLLLNFASYCNNLSSIDEKYSSDPESLEESEMNNLKNLVGNIKYYVIYSFKKIKAMKKYLNIDEDLFKSTETLYKEIRDSSVPNREIVDDFVDKINLILVESKVSELFENKVSEMNNMFKKDDETTTNT